MIKFSALGENTMLVGFGLSEGNLEQLRKEKPIVIDLQKDMGLNFKLKIMIFYGQTESLMKEKLEKYIDKDTVIIGEDPDYIN